MKLWIARDLSPRGAGLCLFKNKPHLDPEFPGEWFPDEGYHPIDSGLYPEVTFENSPRLLVLAQEPLGRTENELV